MQPPSLPGAWLPSRGHRSYRENRAASRKNPSGSDRFRLRPRQTFSVTGTPGALLLDWIGRRGFPPSQARRHRAVICQRNSLFGPGTAPRRASAAFQNPDAPRGQKEAPILQAETFTVHEIFPSLERRPPNDLVGKADAKGTRAVIQQHEQFVQLGYSPPQIGQHPVGWNDAQQVKLA